MGGVPVSVHILHHFVLWVQFRHIGSQDRSFYTLVEPFYHPVGGWVVCCGLLCFDFAVLEPLGPFVGVVLWAAVAPDLVRSPMGTD